MTIYALAYEILASEPERRKTRIVLIMQRHKRKPAGSNNPRKFSQPVILGLDLKMGEYGKRI